MNMIKSLLLSNSSTKQILFKNTFWLLLGEVISKGLLFVVTISIVRYLDVEIYGKYASAISFTSLFSVLVDFGLGTMLVQELSHNGKEHAQKLLSSILSLKLILAAVTACIIFIASTILHDDDVTRLVYLSGIYMLVQSFVLVFPALFQAFENMQYSFLVRTGSNILLCALVLTAIAFKLPVQGIFYAYIMTAVTIFLLTIGMVERTLFQFKWQIDRQMIATLMRRSWPLFLGNVCVVLYMNIDTTMLSFMRNYEEVGVYQAAYKILFVFATFQLIHTALYPRMAELYKHNRPGLSRLLFTIMTTSIIILLPAVFVIGLFRHEIVHLVYSTRFSASADVMILLIIGGVISYFSGFFSSLLLIQKRQILLFVALLIGLSVNIFINLSLIPLLGPVGAGIAYISGFLAQLFAMILFVKA